MDKSRFETQKHVVNLDPNQHPIQNYFTIEDLKWLIEQAEKVERYERALVDIMINCPNPIYGVVARLALENENK